MTPELTRAIGRIYSVFQNVERPKFIDGCPCCLDDDEICTLLSKDIREITPNELSAYASSVFLTVGAEADFRYFLPRILEILYTENLWWPDPEIVGRALGTYSWDRFTTSEQAALVEFFDEVFKHVISDPKIDGYELDSWLCCASHIVPHWCSYLEAVGSSSTALLALYEWHATELSRGALANGFWDDSPKRTEFKEWITDLVDKGAIQSAYGL